MTRVIDINITVRDETPYTTRAETTVLTRRTQISRGHWTEEAAINLITNLAKLAISTNTTQNSQSS
jgi:hypothetical protein